MRSNVWLDALQAEHDSAARVLARRVATAMYGNVLTDADGGLVIPWHIRLKWDISRRWYNLRYWLAVSVLRVQECETDEP